MAGALALDPGHRDEQRQPVSCGGPFLDPGSGMPRAFCAPAPGWFRAHKQAWLPLEATQAADQHDTSTPQQQSNVASRWAPEQQPTQNTEPNSGANIRCAQLRIIAPPGPGMPGVGAGANPHACQKLKKIGEPHGARFCPVPASTTCAHAYTCAYVSARQGLF